jgi:RNA polymerase sigma-70 factor (ECF subfamily)
MSQESAVLHELVRRAQGGDHEAFCELAREVVDGLLRTARHIVGDPGHAEDAVQEALVDAWRYLPTLRDPSRFHGWLHRLLVHACYRSARQSHVHAAEIALQDSMSPVRPDATAGLAVRDELERALRRLSEEHRAVVALLYFADLSLQECSEALGVPVGTVKSRAHRALDVLRGTLIVDERIASTSGRPT